MGLFDFFTKETTSSDKKTTKKQNAQNKNDGAIEFSQPSTISQVDGNVAVRVFKPTSFDDVCAIIDFILLNKPAIVNVEAVKGETTQRVMDILSGACYAVRGSISEVVPNVYLVSPETQQV